MNDRSTNSAGPTTFLGVPLRPISLRQGLVTVAGTMVGWAIYAALMVVLLDRPITSTAQILPAIVWGGLVAEAGFSLREHPKQSLLVLVVGGLALVAIANVATGLLFG